MGEVEEGPGMQLPSEEAFDQVDLGLLGLEDAYTADVWRADELGVATQRGRGTVSFAGISQPWLRRAAKAWARQRLGVNCAFARLSLGSSPSPASRSSSAPGSHRCTVPRRSTGH